MPSCYHSYGQGLPFHYHPTLAYQAFYGELFVLEERPSFNGQPCQTAAELVAKVEPGVRQQTLSADI